ncbi:TPA: hypothetical protein ACF351_000504 [Clostridium perfringens]|uniref:hypothetical protein n=1 Tax=Clostridia TaxID=186801 RepID=UPI001A2B418F|nr:MULTISPECIES: hypothetical protein [Clostridiaceae]MBS5954874.1 hypothetical protein [Paraclostridium bifermentans]MDH5096708.1 hypothetical protein [Clostridium perfringens]HAT4145528.1 hypothetical protein [Clostridium perfringens]HBI6977189.1 hypothetical protein [Clostridium perfringens]HBI7000051.1 hypothetical protein [Clostridium perfringens]
MCKKIGNFKDIKDVEELRNKFQNVTNDLNKIIDLYNSEKNNDELEKELEIALALFLMHCLEIQDN